LCTPKTAKQLKGFLGLAGYYRFIPQFSKIAAPLHKLLKKDAKYEWEGGQENAFQTLKLKFSLQEVLQEELRKCQAHHEPDAVCMYKKCKDTKTHILHSRNIFHG
jgi:hypothetical protein